MKTYAFDTEDSFTAPPVRVLSDEDFASMTADELRTMIANLLPEDLFFIRTGNVVIADHRYRFTFIEAESEAEALRFTPSSVRRTPRSARSTKRLTPSSAGARLKRRPRESDRRVASAG
jgi:hypothetical protein